MLGVVAAGVLALSPYLWVRAASAGHIYDPQEVPTAPVAIVFGAGIRADGTPMTFLQARLDLARDLYQRGKVKAVLVTGDNRTPDYDEPTAMRNYLVSQGVPASVVVRDFAGRDTYDSCVRASRVFGVTRAIVVSQGYHVPRVVTVCRAVGVEADGVGDWSTRALWGLQRGGALREVAASPKAVWDVLTGREPILGPPEDALKNALAGTDP